MLGFHPLSTVPISSLAAVENVTTSQTQSGLSRIRTSVDVAQTGVARISASVSRTQAGVSRITAATTQPQTGVSRVTASTDRAQAGVADIRATTNRTQAGTGRVQVTVTSTQTGTGRVQKSVDVTQTGVSRIILERGYSYASLGSLPADAAPLANSYSLAEIDDTETLDASYVDAAGTDQFLIHLFRDLMTGSETQLARAWTGRFTLPLAVSTIYLQIYNFADETWETVDSKSSGSSPVTLSGSVTANIADYFDADNITAWRVYQEVG